MRQIQRVLRWNRAGGPQGPGSRLCPGVAFLLLLLLSGFFSPLWAFEIRDVSISKGFFNPTLGQKIELSFSLGRPGSVTVLVLDRDGFLVRTLAKDKPAKSGKQSLIWDGRGEKGEIVPDEAYSFKVDLSDKKGETQTYFPANNSAQEFSVKASYYDRRGGILAYKLPKPSRVHIQAGVARIDPETKEPKGPVLKTVVNREPRAGGSVVEAYDGMDESGTIRVSELPNFVMAIAATALPESSVITVGNRRVRFLDHASKRGGRSLFSFSVSDHHHHQGLAALEDSSPALRLTPRNASWLPSERLWRIQEKRLRLA